MSQSERVSEQLKIFFAERGYTQRKIAEIIGVSQQVVQTLLNGRAFGKKLLVYGVSILDLILHGLLLVREP